ncbi:hypothetical protein DLM46_30290 [Paraburkholderia lacunae]|uniref:Uncharacterized protein n=1 Tax=Paraburkholderia lacunae TaxID=2211104 RepID=A0A370N0U3_9BURK|nr:hypothetical protein [Paraburkholderia lacunae]RDJ99077.1 hypothetical protein DLM46_30290 [Paraburkholderia lacunae]
MEHMVRVLNDRDRRTLAWLRQQVSDASLSEAARRCSGPTKPYVSQVCRCLGLRPPEFRASRTHSPHVPTATAEQSLASIREILAAMPAGRTSGQYAGGRSV